VVLGVSPNYRNPILNARTTGAKTKLSPIRLTLVLDVQVRLQNLSAAMWSGAIGSTLGKHMTANSSSSYSAYACLAKPGSTRTDHLISYSQLAGRVTKWDLEVT
jgi:hypothetical protein